MQLLCCSFRCAISSVMEISCRITIELSTRNKKANSRTEKMLQFFFFVHWQNVDRAHYHIKFNVRTFHIFTKQKNTKASIQHRRTEIRIRNWIGCKLWYFDWYWSKSITNNKHIQKLKKEKQRKIMSIVCMMSVDGYKFSLKRRMAYFIWCATRFCQIDDFMRAPLCNGKRAKRPRHTKQTSTTMRFTMPRRRRDA